MDRKTKILIASLLGRIEVAPEKKYGKAGFLDSKLLMALWLEAGGFCQIPYPSPLHSTPSNNE